LFAVGSVGFCVFGLGCGFGVNVDFGFGFAVHSVFVVRLRVLCLGLEYELEGFV
jgi:hypothetical protein